jgi:LysR family glycine cleavage system transcriptional activator
MPKLPPLNAVRAFVSAASHVSFSKAAEELHVTRGAISRHVALLEEWLGQPLFIRGAAQLELTDVGRNYLIETSAALTRLAYASEYLSRNESSIVLRLNAPPTFTMRWLITRMSTFQRRHPEIDLRVTTYRPTDLIREEEFDVGIRGRAGPLPGAISVPFLVENVVPICHPDLLGTRDRLQLEDLEKHTLITFTTESYTWPEWLESVGYAPSNLRKILRFDPMYFALQAAQEGLGIVLVPMFTVIDDLISGKLCAPFGLLGERRRDYYVSYPKNSSLASTIEIFTDWLIHEGKSTHQAISQWAETIESEKKSH